MTSFQATLVNAGFGQLALRDQHGKIAQKWTLGGPKCVIGAHANCNVRCMLPGIADHHLLLVIGSRQLYMRALAPGVDREGVAVNELVLSGDQDQLAFHLAGHRFEYSRENYSNPTAKVFVEESGLLASGSASSRAAQTEAVRAQDARPQAGPDNSKRLRFTFVQALERNRDRSQSASPEAAGVEASAAGSQRPAWVEEIVRDALRPVELRLETIAGPINNLERQLRRQRARQRKQQQARKLSRHAAHEANPSHTQNLIEAQETIQKIVADQAARLELVNERVGDIVSQLASLERIVSAENVQHQEVVSRSSRSGEEIIRLQREMLALVNALETRIDQPPSTGDDAQWRASIERQLEELHQSLSILDEIKSSLDNAVCQNRELAEDLQAHWQAIEEASQRPVVIQSVPVLPPHTPETPASPQPAPVADAPAAAFLSASQSTSLLVPAASRPSVPSAGALPSWPQEASLPSAPNGASPATSGDVRLASAAPSSDPIALPSWWSDDPVAPSDPTYLSDPQTGVAQTGDAQAGASPAAEFALDEARPEAHVFVDDQPYDAVPSVGLHSSGSELHERTMSLEANLAGGSDWHPTEYEQETDPRQLQRPWPYAPQAIDDAKNDFPSLDVPELLTSAIADPLPGQSSPLSYADPTSLAPSYVKQPYAEQTFDEQTFVPPEYAQPAPAETDAIGDASHAASRSAAELEGQLQRWLADGYGTEGPAIESEDERFSTLAIDPAKFGAAQADDLSFPTDRAYPQLSPAADGMVSSQTASDDEFAVSAFSAEGLAIVDAESNLAPTYEEATPYRAAADYSSHSTYSESPDYGEAGVDDAGEDPAAAAYQLPYQEAEQASEAHASPGGYDNGGTPAAEAGEESVEDYMRRLLARMRGVSETEVTLPGLDRAQTPTVEAEPRTPQPTSSALGTSAPGTSASGTSASSDTQPISEAWTEPFDPTKYVPRVAAPENTSNIDALRELANTSARSAIHVSARRKHGTAIMIKSGVAFVGLAAGAALVSINGVRVNIGLIATLASFTVAIIWGYDALATLRPLLQASRAAKSQAPQPTEAEAEEAAQ